LGGFGEIASLRSHVCLPMNIGTLCAYHFVAQAVQAMTLGNIRIFPG